MPSDFRSGIHSHKFIKYSCHLYCYILEVSAVVRSTLLQMIRISKSTPYFVQWGRFFLFYLSYLSLTHISKFSSTTHNTLGQVLYPLGYMFLRRSVYEFWVLINIMFQYLFFYQRSCYNFLLLFFHEQSILPVPIWYCLYVLVTLLG